MFNFWIKHVYDGYNKSKKMFLFVCFLLLLFFGLSDKHLPRLWLIIKFWNTASDIHIRISGNLHFILAHMSVFIKNGFVFKHLKSQ